MPPRDWRDIERIEKCASKVRHLVMEDAHEHLRRVRNLPGYRHHDHAVVVYLCPLRQDKWGEVVPRHWHVGRLPYYFKMTSAERLINKRLHP